MAKAAHRPRLRRAGCGARSNEGRSASVAVRKSGTLAGAAQHVHREVLVAVRPYRRRVPTGAARHRTERLDRILVAVLGVDGFAGAEIDGFPAHAHLLPLQAGEVHLDPRLLAVIEGVMLERRQLEVGPK